MKTERVSTTNTALARSAVLSRRPAGVNSILSQHARVETVSNSSTPNLADEPTYMSRPYLGPTKTVAHRLDHAGHLVMRAMTLFESNRDAAWGCLSDAWTLLAKRPERFSMTSQSRRVDACFGGLAPWQTKRVLSYVEANLGSKIGLQELADLASLSCSHFARAFKQCIGCPPMAYVAARRLERAKLMMTSTREMLANIALACGYGDQSHLTKRFRQVIGVSPGRWRRMAMFRPE